MKPFNRLMLVVLVTIILIYSVEPYHFSPVDLPVSKVWYERPVKKNNFSPGDPIVIAIGEWPPYVGQNLDQHGFISEIVHLAMTDAGLNYTLQFYPWKRCEEGIISGDVWASYPYIRSEERSVYYWYSEPLFQTLTKFFYYSPKFDGKKVYYKELTDLKSYRIGGVYANYYKPLFETAGLQVDWSSREEDTIHKLVSGRIDLMPYGELEGWSFVRQYYPDEIQHFGYLSKAVNIDSGDLVMIYDKTNAYSQALMDQFNQSLLKIRQDGRYDQLLKKYQLNSDSNLME